MFLLWGNLVPLVVLAEYLKLVEGGSHIFFVCHVVFVIILITFCLYVSDCFSFGGNSIGLEKVYHDIVCALKLCLNPYT